MKRFALITCLTLGLTTPVDLFTAKMVHAQRNTRAANALAGRDALARQQAEAAVALLKRGRGAKVWPILRHSADPSVRTYLIHSLARSGVSPAAIIRRLETERR